MKRKTRLARSEVSAIRPVLGAGFSDAYFWALAPNYDLTVTPTLTSKQGLLLQARMAPPADERLLFDQGGGHIPGRPGRVREAFSPLYPATRTRATACSAATSTPPASSRSTTTGSGAGTARSSPTAWSSRTTALRTYFAVMDPFKSGGLETVTQLYLTGAASAATSTRARCISTASRQATCRASFRRAPVIDYRNRLAKPAVRRRADLPGKHHQPVARQRRLRSDHAERIQHRAVRPPDRRSERRRCRPTVSCAAFPAPIRAHPRRRRGGAR